MIKKKLQIWQRCLHASMRCFDKGKMQQSAMEKGLMNK